MLGRFSKKKKDEFKRVESPFDLLGEEPVFNVNEQAKQEQQAKQETVATQTQTVQTTTQNEEKNVFTANTTQQSDSTVESGSTPKYDLFGIAMVGEIVIIFYWLLYLAGFVPLF